MDETQLRERLCQALRQLWTRGMIIGADGMLCCEVNRRRYLSTPMDQRRVDIEPGDLVCVDIGGENMQGGEGILPELWQPHRDVYQTHMDLAGETLGASAVIEPPNVLALLSRSDGVDRLDLGGGDSIPVVGGDDTAVIRQVLTDSTEVVLSGRGLFVAAADLPTLLNRIERIDFAATVRLAAGHA